MQTDLSQELLYFLTLIPRIPKDIVGETNTHTHKNQKKQNKPKKPPQKKPKNPHHTKRNKQKKCTTK